MSVEESINLLKYGLTFCEITKTELVHITQDEAREMLDVLEKQERIIAQYKKADAFLAAHGWKWENIDG